ncbi:MAG TPA: S8 family serine peptidase [Steroidobacteraceae bacterium]
MIRTVSSLLAGALVAALAACAGVPARPPANAMPDAVRVTPERFLVVTVHDAPRREPTTYGAAFVSYGPSSQARATAAAIATDYGLQEAASWPIRLLGVHCVVYGMPPAADRRDILARLTADRRVESAQPLATFATQASAYNDPYARLQSSLALLNVAEAQQWSRGSGVRVAIVDTGVDTAHPDLQGRVATMRNFVDADADAFATDAHGTAVAGVIAAVANNGIGIAGIAPDVRLLVYKACWREAARPEAAVCNSFTLAQAIAAAIGARANVVNLSLAGPPDRLLARIVAQGQRKGVVFVGAAPPDGASSGFPGDVEGVVMVDAPGRRSGTPAALVAPGRDVLTLVPGAHYDFASGSSLAAAQTSGVVALMLEANPKLRADEVARLLTHTSHQVTSPSGRFVAINACAALVAVRQEGRCPEAREASVAHDRERTRTE